MHVHTCHSDGLATIPHLIKHAKKHQIGFAITDHNEISGAVKAVSYHENVLIIPGIELETMEGPHLLIYFYSVGELIDFFKDFSHARNRLKSGLPKNIPVLECLTLAEPYNCLRVAAHPFGYFGINRGVLKCTEKNMLPGVLEKIDAIEVICGGMMENLNKKAIHYAKKHQIPFTGGSDAHILPDVGSVVTGVCADTAVEFLEGIRHNKNIVMGRPSGYLHKGATAGVIAYSFLPFAIDRAYSYYQNFREKPGSYSKSTKNPAQNNEDRKTEKSEERGEKP
jgi:hypothetical protein